MQAQHGPQSGGIQFEISEAYRPTLTEEEKRRLKQMPSYSLLLQHSSHRGNIPAALHHGEAVKGRQCLRRADLLVDRQQKRKLLDLKAWCEITILLILEMCYKPPILIFYDPIGAMIDTTSESNVTACVKAKVTQHKQRFKLCKVYTTG